MILPTSKGVKLFLFSIFAKVLGSLETNIHVDRLVSIYKIEHLCFMLCFDVIWFIFVKFFRRIFVLRLVSVSLLDGLFRLFERFNCSLLSCIDELLSTTSFSALLYFIICRYIVFHFRKAFTAFLFWLIVLSWDNLRAEKLFICTFFCCSSFDL